MNDIEKVNLPKKLLYRIFSNLFDMYQFSKENERYIKNLYTDEEFEEIEKSFCVEEDELSESEILLGTQFILESTKKYIDSDDIADILNISHEDVQKTLLKFKEMNITEG